MTKRQHSVGVMYCMIILMIIMVVLYNQSKDYKQVQQPIQKSTVVQKKLVVHKSKVPTINAGVTEILEKKYKKEENKYPEFTYNKDFTIDELQLLAKIAMAEGEGENIQTKTLVIMTVLNRVYDKRFPDTIYDVITQEVGGIHQFSPLGDGRWNEVEPNDECWEAVRVVLDSQYDYSDGALYFEACENEDNWHNKHLRYLYQSQDVRFYK